MPDEAFCHLCQPDAGKSCGACCGIYNYADSSRESLTRRLSRRTEIFRRHVRSAGDLPTFSRAIRGTEDQERRFAVIHCCEYVGFLDQGQRRVGCLLHPARNRGRDLRHVSFYGRDLCDGHFCPSYSFLHRTEQLALIDWLDDWYLYGLCVTDVDLVKGYFRHLADRLGGMPESAILRNDAVRRAARRFFEYKLTWPFRAAETNRFGRFFFDGSQHMIRPIDYAALGSDRSRYDGIFLSLASDFRTAEALREAERLIGANIAAAAAAIAGRT